MQKTKMATNAKDDAATVMADAKDNDSDEDEDNKEDDDDGDKAATRWLERRRWWRQCVARGTRFSVWRGERGLGR